MNDPLNHNINKAEDSIQKRLTSYAYGLDYRDLPVEVIHAAKVRTVDTLGALIAGFFGEPCRIARNLAAQLPNSSGATIIGTRMKTTPDMAAFVNVITARHEELSDVYTWPDSFQGHPNEILTPVLAAAECALANGQELITSIVLAYEIYMRLSDVFHNSGFDHTNFCCLGSAVGAAKLLGLSPMQISHCISMAIVPNNALRQSRIGHMSMFKAAASGLAGRAGVFAALLARAGMEGPHLPFEGKAGWCEHVAREHFSFNTMGGNGTPYKILDSAVKLRPAAGNTVSSILAAEKIAPLKNIKEVEKVTVELYRRAKQNVGTGEHRWNPDSRESADHSAPYVVAVTLMDGTVTRQSFNDAHLGNEELRALMQKIEVIENEEFTQAYHRIPQIHRTRVSVTTATGERLVGESGGDSDDPSTPKSDAQITKKFRELTDGILGTAQIDAILDRLWHLEKLKDVGQIASSLVLT